MSKRTTSVSGAANFFYCLANIFTFGGYWLIKTTIKKAIDESK